jgi:broad specificity phosphatase PhoE
MIIFVRHGENDYVKKGRLAGRLPEIHLNKTGLAQAQAAAEALSKMLEKTPPKAVYSSPLERTMQTALPIASTFGLEVTPRQGLIETDVGEWQGKTVKQLSRLKIWKTVQKNPSVFRFPGGESFAECQCRISQEIQSLTAMHDPKEAVICVSHSDPIKLAVAFFLGLPLDLFQRLGLAPASITALHLSDNGCFLHTLNYIPSISLPES